MISRGSFTQFLITRLGSFALPVGDNDAPTTAHGWQGEPNATSTNFIPWLIVAPGSASRSDGSFGDAQQEWRLPYYVTSCGVTRQQTESVADKIRTELKTYSNSSLSLKTEDWRLTTVLATTIGAVSRIGTTNPPYHIQTDTLEFWLSKELS